MTNGRPHGTYITCFRCKRKKYGKDLAAIAFWVRLIDGKHCVVCKACKDALVLPRRETDGPVQES
jgi:hypothetical protein